MLREWYRLHNSRYYGYVDIDNTVIFSSSYPGSVHIQYPQNIIIGRHSVINANSSLNAHGGIRIGCHCHFGEGLTIYSSNHDINSNEAIPYGFTDKKAMVVIKDFVWMGANVSVVPGVVIGEGVVIGMGSVVTKNCPPLSIMAGNPAKIIGTRDVDLFYQLKTQQRFN